MMIPVLRNTANHLIYGKTVKQNSNTFYGYESFESIRKKKPTALRGSGGVSLFVKDWVLQTNGVTRFFQEFKECVVLLLKADIFHRKKDLVMYFTYIAPENSPIYTEEDNGITILNERISEVSLQYPDAELFLAGDLNACISTMQDFIPEDDLEFIFGDTDYPTDPFDMQRRSKDETYNRFGISLLDLCCTHNIHVLNGRLFDDKNGEITCVANGGSNVVDYILASTTLFESFQQFKIGYEDFSDHFPLNCTLLLSDQHLLDSEPLNQNLNGTNWTRFKWKETFRTEFVQLFSRLYSDFKVRVSTVINPVLPHLFEFINIIQKAGKCMKVRNMQNKSGHQKTQPQ